MANSNTFYLVRNDKDEFFIEAPDESQSEWTPVDSLAALSYKGRLYVATMGGDVPGITAGKVYTVANGAAIPTELADYDGDDDDDDDDAVTVDDDDNDDDENADDADDDDLVDDDDDDAVIEGETEEVEELK